MPPEAEVRFDFCSLTPTRFASWRGIYAELALGWTADPAGPLTVAELLELARACVGQTFHGWKGGEFAMRSATRVWVDNPGESTMTKLSMVRLDGDGVVILDTRREEVV
jgi:hypothetical protein